MKLTVCLTNLEHVEVTSYKEAGQAVQAFLTRTGMGSGDFYKEAKAGLIFSNENNDGEWVGEVYLKRGLAHVSYNGRVWQGTDRFNLGQTEIVFE